jgi:hypothetical protein
MWRSSSGRVSRREEVGAEGVVVWDRSDMDFVLREEREAEERGVISCLVILKEVKVLVNLKLLCLVKMVSLLAGFVS